MAKIAKECELCERPFEASRKNTRFCSREHYKPCEACGKEFLIKNPARISKTCSSSCASVLTHSKEADEKRRLTTLERYGVEHVFQSEEVKEKIAQNENVKASHFGGENFKKTMLDKYGVENIGSLRREAMRGDQNPMAKKETREKVKATVQERYGVDNVFDADEIKDKIKKTNLERYGTETPIKNEVIQEKRKKTNLEKYGAESPLSNKAIRERIEETNLKKYGSKSTFSNEDIKKKIAATNKAIYGYENPFSSPAIQKKAKETMVQRYGVSNPSQFPERSAIIRETSLKHYGVSHYMASPQVQEKMKQTMLERYGVEHSLQVEEFKLKAMATYEQSVNSGLVSRGRISKLNKNFAERLKVLYGVDVTFEKAVGAYAYDLCLEETKLLIDLNPTVSHNSTFAFACLLKGCEPCCEIHKPLAPNYHFLRAKNAQQEGYRLIQLFDWDDPAKLEAFLGAKINENITKLSARKTKVKTLPSSEAREFLEKNHIQGWVRGASHSYGLFLAEDLLAVATFGKARFGAKAEYEFLRYAVKPGVLIHGGAQKLFREFLQEVSPESVISYVDFGRTTGPTFLPTLGFTEQRPTGPSLIWHRLRDNKTIPETSLLKVGADKLLGTAYGPRETSGLDNQAIMEKEGFVKVFTPGNRVFLWKNLCKL